MRAKSRPDIVRDRCGVFLMPPELSRWMIGGEPLAMARIGIGPTSLSLPGETVADLEPGHVRWLERKGLMVKPDLVRRVVDSIAHRNSFHPVRDYLESLPAWDGKPRIGSWLIEYCGVESSDANPNYYAMSVGEKFLISAIALILAAGCKADHILVLEGIQGIGKSTAALILAGEWFTDQLGEVGSKDASMQV
jgi:predicted P-loop ATPase